MDDIRLIDANALKDKLISKAGSIKGKNRFDKGESWGYELAAKMVSRFPKIDPESLRPVSEWELNPYRFSCEHFRCKKCHHIDCVADNYCGKCGAKMKNAGVKPEELPVPEEENSSAVKSNDGNGEWEWEECEGTE